MDLAEKLRKVKALLEGAKTVAEAEAASAAWQRIVMRHNLDEAEAARLSGKPASSMLGRPVKIGDRGGKEVVWMGDLLHVIADYNLCKAYREESDSFANMFLVGSEENVEAVLALWEKLCKLIPILSLGAYAQLKHDIRYNMLAARMTPSKESYPVARTWRHGFHRGFPHGLEDKLKEEREKEKKQFGGTSALVLVTDTAIVQFVEEVGKVRAGAKPAEAKEADGYIEGYKAGKRWEELQELSAEERDLALAG